jgi:hypothetical protein
VAEVIGVGDCHLDKLDPIIPEASQLITRCWRRVFKYALDNGVQDVFFYGDIGEKPRLSDEAMCQIADTIFREEYRELNLHFILGNHDWAEDGQYSLRWLEIMAKRLDLNFKVYTKPTIVDIDGVPFQMTPYPHEETVKDAVNVIHHEVSGSTRDNGRTIDDGPTNKHVCLAGHLHTPHKVRNTHYSGTLYQTNFGEAMPKFFHHAVFNNVTDNDVQLVPFKPPWELNNLVVKTAKDLKKIESEANMLYKLFVHDGADIDIDAVLQKYPNVVRHNSFKSKKDLQEQIDQAWAFDEDAVEEDVVNDIDDERIVEEHLAKNFTPDRVKRGLSLLKTLKGQ